MYIVNYAVAPVFDDNLSVFSVYYVVPGENDKVSELAKIAMEITKDVAASELETSEDLIVFKKPYSLVDAPEILTESYRIYIDENIEVDDSENLKIEIGPTVKAVAHSLMDNKKVTIYVTALVSEKKPSFFSD